MRISTVMVLLSAVGCAHHTPRHEPNGYALFELVADGKPLVGSTFHLWIGANNWFVGELLYYGEAGPIAMGRWERPEESLVLHPTDGKPVERYELFESRGQTYLVREEDLDDVCGQLPRPFAFRLWRGDPPFEPVSADRVCPSR